MTLQLVEKTRPVVMSAEAITLAYQQSRSQKTMVLQDFSFQLYAGEAVMLLGSSGVGKSSLLRVLAGLQKATQGEVFIDDKLVQGPHPRLSFMFQDPSLLPWLTVEENVAFGLDFKHQPKLSKKEQQQRVQQVLKDVGLSHAAKAKPGSLSGGMAQRVALARSLARQPEILLLDEPFSALDEVTRSEMQQLLKQVCKKYHTAVVMVTHDIDEALLLADRILMIGGKPGRLLNDQVVSATTSETERCHIRESILATLKQTHQVSAA